MSITEASTSCTDTAVFDEVGRLVELEDLMSRGSFDQVIDAYTPIFDEFDEINKIYVSKALGLANLDTSRFEDGLRFIEHNLAAGGEPKEILPLIAIAFIEMQLTDNALEILSIFSKIDGCLAEGLFLTGRCKETKEELAEAAAFFSKSLDMGLANKFREEALLRLSSIYSRLRMDLEAKCILEELVEFNPSGLAYSELSRCYRVSGFSELAVETAVIGVEKFSSELGWTRLVEARISAKQFEEARADLQMAQNFFKRSHMLDRAAGKLMMYVQDWELARDLNLSAASGLAPFLISQDQQSPQKNLLPPLPVELAKETLMDLKWVLDKANVEFFLTFGTLLGCIRSGSFIGHDKDIDVGMWWETDRSRLRDALNSSGRFKKVQDIYFQPRDEDQLTWTESFRHCGTGVAVDINFFKRDGLKTLAGFCDSPKEFIYQFPTFDLVEMIFQEMIVKVPDSATTHLEAIYGESWQVPLANFDTVVMAQNLTNDSRCVSDAYGFGRLYDTLVCADWDRSKAYLDYFLSRSEWPSPIETELNTLRTIIA